MADDQQHPLSDLGFQPSSDVVSGRVITPGDAHPLADLGFTPVEGTKLPAPAGWHTDASGQPVINDSAYPWSLHSLATAPGRMATSFDDAMGAPANIKDWPKAIAALSKGPIPQTIDPTTGVNFALNMAKGMVKSSGVASQSGIDQFNQPGVINKSAGALKYVIGGMPIVGPAIVRSMEEAEKGNYAGMIGTLGAVGTQALIANPDAAAARMDAAGKYLFSKPRVQETILAGETKEMLTSAESTARKRVIAMAPKYDDIPP